MAIPLAIPIALSAASTIPKWYQAWKQNNLADKLEKDLSRPDFEIPESEKRALESAKVQSGMTRLPGQSGIEGRLDQETANKLNTIERMGIGGPTDINAASTAYGQQQEGETNLGIKASDMYLRNQDVLRSQLDKMGEWEFKAWNWDKKLPYENRAEAIQALREGSIRNLNTAASETAGGFANIALSEYMRGKNEDMWKSMFGDKGELGSVENPMQLTNSPYTPSPTWGAGQPEPQGVLGSNYNLATPESKAMNNPFMPQLNPIDVPGSDSPKSFDLRTNDGNSWDNKGWSDWDIFQKKLNVQKFAQKPLFEKFTYGMK